METKKINIRDILKVIFQLGKVRISIPVAFTTFTGYVLSRGKADAGFILPVTGIFLLACGASALNQIQEFGIDKRMNRTQNRPLPSGRTSLPAAWIITLAFFFGGSLVLLLGPGFETFCVGIATFAWYNAIYTPLKKVTAFAAVYGSMVGALPPLAGWVAGGGSIIDNRAIILAFFFFIGQIPHFWLLLLKFGKQYEEADLPSLTKLLSIIQIKRLTFIWIAATGVTAFALPVFKVVDQLWASIAVIILSIGIILFFARLLFKSVEFKVGRSFVFINVYYLFIMLILIGSKTF
ncbi:MAG: protoheme IX farnesyltransferase [Bacteroidetes bacterium]|nr:protoheme IX farnesyltransferase [Bacteroidota bacterium]